MICNILQALMSSKHVQLHLNRTTINIFQDYTDFRRVAILLVFVFDFLCVSSSCLFITEIMLALSLQLINDAQEKSVKTILC